MKKIAVILAGGEGIRAGGNIPKQFRELCGKAMLRWSIKAFADESRQTHILCVIHPSYRESWARKVEMYARELGVVCEIVDGGATRFDSVANALKFIDIMPGDLVAVHDAARPLVTPELISRGWQAAEISKAAVPVVPLSDSIRFVEAGGGNRSVDRSLYRAVQTPQVFDGGMLKKAYGVPRRDLFTDDASVVESAGVKVALYEGDVCNIKVTNPMDFAIAEVLMERR